MLYRNLRDPQVLLPTIVNGLQLYFDRALGSTLLYRFERVQYADVRKKYITGPTVTVGKEKEMSEIYGAEHLLRMLGACDVCFYVELMGAESCVVSLPQMVASSTMDPESVGLLRDYVNKLFEYVFVSQYLTIKP